ncbi:MAG: hypothetical protein ACYDG2_02150 [Ruminiclostridium sp.]
MKDLIYQYADQYARSADQDMSSKEDQLSANHPVLFLLVGDKVTDALHEIHREIKSKWKNSDGILFFHITLKKAEDTDSMFQFQIPIVELNQKVYRKAISQSFYKDEQLLINLNYKMRLIKNKILEFGKMYASWERINIAVITHVDDPMNILLPEITLLLKTKLMGDFKLISQDFYGLIKEKDDAEDFEYSSAVAMSFFRELEYVQNPEYSFNKPIEVLSGGIKLDVTNTKQPLFDMVYLLSDKNEQGIIKGNITDENYEIISYINLLKNRKFNITLDNALVGQYNDYQFKQDVTASADIKQAYISAGLSKVKRPNAAIAIAVLSHFYNTMHKMLKQNKMQNKNELLKLFELDDSGIALKINKIVGIDEKMDEMAGLMSSNVGFSHLKTLTFKQAENELYNDLCERFFRENYSQPAYQNFENLKLKDEVDDIVKNYIINDPKLGIYCAYTCTDDQEILEEIRKLKVKAEMELNLYEGELRDAYDEPVESISFYSLPFFAKQNIRKLKENIFEKIYKRKLKLLKLELKRKLLEGYESTIEKVHDSIGKETLLLEDIDSKLTTAAYESCNEADKYLGQNILEYYKAVVESIIKELEAKRGEGFYFQDKYIGSIHMLLKQGTNSLLEKVLNFCKNNILNNPQFLQSFEDELLNRANVVIDYSNKEALSKEDLFKKLYDMLEDNAAINCYLFNYTHKHRYEEKYFFGDYYSDFLQYAFAFNRDKRTYKLGCVHEKRTSGIEKLNLMGGFQITDLVFARNCMKYYKTYLSEGFELHNIDIELLPKIECSM